MEKLTLKKSLYKSGNPETLPLVDYKYAGGNKYHCFVEQYYPSCSDMEKKSLELIVYNACRANVKEKSVCYSRDQSFYKQNRYSQKGYTYPHFKNMVDRLTSDGFLNHQMGYKDANTKLGFQSNFIATKSLISILEYVNVKKEMNECLCLNTRILSDDGTLDTSTKRVDYIDTKTTKALRDDINFVNIVQGRHRWSLSVDWLDDYSEVVEHLSKVVLTQPSDSNSFIGLPTFCGYTVNNESYIEKTALKPTYWDLDSLSYFRVFGSSRSKNGKELWDTHGRWYSSLTNIKRELRKNLLVNNKPTTEVDYKAHHPQILYTYEKLQTPTDCYTLVQNPLPRSLVKLMSLIMINASDLKTAQHAIYNTPEYRDYLALPGPKVKIIDAINEYREIHKPISKYFFTGIGRQLMNIDSRIVAIILKELSNKNIPCLAIHDSFIVPVPHKTVLEQLMVTAFQHVLSTSIIPAFTVKH